MLSVFPTMFLALLAHAILRVVLGGILFYLGVRHLRKQPLAPNAITSASSSMYLRGLGMIECILGGLFVIGLVTQIAALIGIVMAIVALVFHKRLHSLRLPQPLFYILFLGACLSLFITGAGVLAVDLPI